ncbi:MAG: hypothetical protein JRI23_05850 [Deltaproteobacteria bacterium]|jgi:hypothetical protein|nr:hypothetical protein [Deltaproteobacteria bacterium]MBW2531086.1 hypothetical protein [Deltaproteobacteria bacterium]
MSRNPSLSRVLTTAGLGVALTLVGAQAACVADTSSSQEDALTSLTARERTMTFEGYVYVHPDASADEIREAVLGQTRSAFGALRTQDVAVGSRELANVDESTFIREPLRAVDADTGDEYETLRVRYLYSDRAVVPNSMSRRSALSLGLLHGDYATQAKRILQECTENTADDREMESDIWYVFNPALPSCKSAMAAEQRLIDDRRSKLLDDDEQIVLEELDRLYIPMTARLAAVEGSRSAVYPEYDRLWRGGIEPGVLTVGLINGMIDHAEPGKTHHPVDDAGYWEMLAEMEAILEARPGLRVVATDPPSDLSTFTVDGERITGLTFQDFINWELYEWGFPTWLSSTQQTALRKLVAERLYRRWVTFEEQVSVAIGDEGPRTVKIRINQYFGAEEDLGPYQRAIRSSDVFLYNGHSYIGEGPLDPANYQDADFPETYQLLFIDSCLSFNYYNSDYFAYKGRGSLDLDIITNGLESFADGAGAGQGRFVAALLSGEQPSYQQLLERASTTGTGYAWGLDALRVVDGELDNEYSPARTPISVGSPEL